MKFLWTLCKCLVMLALVCLAFYPLLAEYLSFRKERKKGVSHKRLRILVFTLVYGIGITIALVALKDLYLTARAWKWVQWLVAKLGVPGRVEFSLSVIGVLLLNGIIGLLYRLLLRLVRIGLNKKNLTVPKGKDGEFTLLQRAERWVIRFFNREKWFFAGKTLQILAITLTVVYGLVFLLWQLPIFFSASWIPYAFILRLFGAGYLYPMITLLFLWQGWFFLAGVERVEKEAPELQEDTEGIKLRLVPPDLETIKKECQKLFYRFFARELKRETNLGELSSAEHHGATKIIAAKLEQAEKNPMQARENYQKCLDVIVENDYKAMGVDAAKASSGVVIRGGFFSDFSAYFLRYLSTVLSRGDHVILVCDDMGQIRATADYLRQHLSDMYSLRQVDGGNAPVELDHPIWRICQAHVNSDPAEYTQLGDSSILVTDMGFLCSEHFLSQGERFLRLTDMVIYVDVLQTVNRFPGEMTIFDATLRNVRRRTAERAKNSSEMDSRAGANKKFHIRYSTEQIQYICFDDARTLGLDSVLKNLLGVEFVSANAMHYSQETMVCCYRYEPKASSTVSLGGPQSARTEENLGVLVNMADYALSFGAGQVALSARQDVPYGDIADSVAANTGNGLQAREDVNLFINQPQLPAKPVVVAFDGRDDLPAAVRRHLAASSGKPELVMLFSRPYLFRDFYLDNLDRVWDLEQQLRIPVRQGGKQAVLRKILAAANSGGISGKEIRRLLSEAKLESYRTLAESGSLNDILRQILLDCNVEQTDSLRLYDFFEYESFQDFGADGAFHLEERVHLRRQGMLFDLITGGNNITLICEGKRLRLPVSKHRLAQNYIVGQNLLHEGYVYTISSIDRDNGKIMAHHTTDGRNDVPYQYLQDRMYYVEWDPASLILEDTTKHLYFPGEGLKEARIAVERRPMEVVTNGYVAVDPGTMDRSRTQKTPYVSISGPEEKERFRQCYRRYGMVKNRVCSSDRILSGPDSRAASEHGARMLSIRLQGKFTGKPDRIANLAAVMLGEILREMFPSVMDSVAVCPVLPQQEEQETALRWHSKVNCPEDAPEQDHIHLLIIEDCAEDLGVISALSASGKDLLKVLFTPIHTYLQWYLQTPGKSDYLHFGQDKAPECFDFNGLAELAKQLGDDSNKPEYKDARDLVAQESCDFCGKRYPKGRDIAELEDGRKMCKCCAENLVGSNKRLLKAHLERAKIYLESTYAIELADDYEFCFESTVKIVNTLKRMPQLQSSSEVPLRSCVTEDKKVYVENSIPSANLSELLVRELTHVWQLKNLPQLDEALAEGHMALVAIQYLRFLGQYGLAAVRTNRYESSDTPGGEGYRRLVRALLAEPVHGNNPFRYLLAQAGQLEQHTPAPQPGVSQIRDLGRPYQATKPDRYLDGNVPYFYYERLTATAQRAYTALVEGIRAHAEEITVDGCGQDDFVIASDAVRYDHPELFWYKTLGPADGCAHLYYGCSAEEAQLLQRQMEEVIPKYLEGITDDMSAYDVALRIHTRIIASVDYDTIALLEEEKNDGPDMDKIDYLRTICGVFLNGKVVCEGYARAVQYLLQKCGVVCAEAVGQVRKEDGEEGGGHAWNIVQMDGDYYYLDTTWDDSSNTVQTVKSTEMEFSYFAITSQELARTRDLQHCPTRMPECNATRCNYFYHNDLVLEQYDLAKIKAIAQAAAQGGNPFFTFKCPAEAVYREAVAQMFTAADDCREAVRAAGKKDGKITGYSYRCDSVIRTVTVYFKRK